MAVILNQIFHESYFVEYLVIRFWCFHVLTGNVHDSHRNFKSDQHFWALRSGLLDWNTFHVQEVDAFPQLSIEFYVFSFTIPFHPAFSSLVPDYV